MPTYKIRKITYEPIELDEDEVMTMAEAARELDRSLRTVISNAEAGRMTLIIDEDRDFHGRKLVLRSEVEEIKKGAAP